MEPDSKGNYHLFSELVDIDNPFNGNVSDNESTKDIKEREKIRCFSFYLSQLNYVEASFQTTVVSGVIFGLFTTLLWWMNLNTSPLCFGEWNANPSEMHRILLISEVVRSIIIMFWPLLTIAPICSWSMIKDSNIIFWCTIGGLVDAIDRLFLYIFAHYEPHWKSYIGNIIYALLTLIISYKFGKHRQRFSTNDDKTIIIILKLNIQFILGVAVVLPYNYVFLMFYLHSSQLVRVMLSCSLIAAFYVPKLIINNVITNLHGIYRPNEGIVFASSFLTSSILVPRLTQAKIENLTDFTIISLVHGIFNVTDKLFLSLRHRLCRCVCKTRKTRLDDSLAYAQQYTAHQSLISVVVETTSIILSNAAAYLLVYYYKKDEITGSRHDGWILLKEMVIKLCIAVGIEWFFNIIALKIQNDWYNIPVLRLWKSEWKFIIIIHLIQIVYVVVYFSSYVNTMLVDDVLRNSTAICIGLFKRL